MNALECIENISNTHLIEYNFKYCLVDKHKKPRNIDGQIIRPNIMNEFVSMTDLLQCNELEKYAGVGISIQASEICAIDIDDCFENGFDISTIDSRGLDILNKFKSIAYCEFSFSGHGMRVLFKAKLIDNYSEKWYIKNEKVHLEYYQPSRSYRYVTVTGKSISDHSVNSEINSETLFWFLNKYMKKPEKRLIQTNTEEIETRTLDQLLIETKRLYFKNSAFQDLWFSKAPGSGKDESERDYKIIAYLYENITQDKNLLKQIFETSPFFKSKDYRHIRKWEQQEGRYYDYVYEQIRRTHI